MYREEVIAELDGISRNHDLDELDKDDKRLHMDMVIMEFLERCGFEDVAEAWARCADEFS